MKKTIENPSVRIEANIFNSSPELKPISSMGLSYFIEAEFENEKAITEHMENVLHMLMYMIRYPQLLEVATNAICEMFDEQETPDN